MPLQHTRELLDNPSWTRFTHSHGNRMPGPS